MGPILPLIARDLNLTFTQVGLLLTLRSLGASFGGATAGVFTDVIGRRKPLLVVNLFLMGVAFAWMGYANSLAVLLLPFLLTGFLNSGWHPPAMSAISIIYPDQRGFALGLHGSGASLLQSLAPLTIGYVLTFISWRTVLKVHFFPGLISAGLLLFLLPPLVASVSSSVRGYSSRIALSFKENPAILGVAALSCLRTMSYRTLDSFLPLYLAFHFGMSPRWIGFYIFLLLFSGTLPETVSGFISDRIGRRGVLITGLLISTACLIMIPFLPAGAPLGMTICVLGFSLISLRSIIMAFGLDLTPPDLGGTTIGFIFSFNQIFTGMGPLLAGILSDRLGLSAAFYFMAAMTLAAAISVGLLIHPKKTPSELAASTESV